MSSETTSLTFKKTSSTPSLTRNLINLPAVLLGRVVTFLPLNEASHDVASVCTELFIVSNIQAQQKARGIFSYEWHLCTNAPKTPFGFFIVNFANRLTRYITLYNPIAEISDTAHRDKRRKLNEQHTPESIRINKSEEWFLTEYEGKSKYDDETDISYIYGIEMTQKNADEAIRLIRQIRLRSPRCFKPSAAFYERLSIGIWQKINFGSLILDWNKVLSIDFPRLTCLKYRDQMLPDSAQNLIPQRMANLAFINNLGYGNFGSIAAFSSNTELREISTKLNEAKLLNKFQKNSPNIAFNLDISKPIKPEQFDLKRLNIKSATLDNADLLPLLSHNDSLVSLSMPNPNNQSLTFLNRFKKLQTLDICHLLSVTDYTLLAGLPITKLTMGQGFIGLDKNCYQAFAKMDKITAFSVGAFFDFGNDHCSFPNLQKFKTLFIDDYIDKNFNIIPSLIKFFKTHPFLKSIKMTVSFSKTNNHNPQKPWRSMSCNNPAELLLKLFSEVNDGSRYIKITALTDINGKPKAYIAETERFSKN